MFPAYSNPALKAYRTVGVETTTAAADPHQLVLLLFNGARAALAAAKGHMERRETEARGKAISQAMSILDGGLKASLDLKVGGELAKNLYDLYVYMEHRLLYANKNNDRAALDEVAKLLEQLGGAWEAIGAKRTDVNAPPKSAAAPQAQRAAISYGSV